MKREPIKEQNWPYETLEKFGLTREMIEDLPMSALDNIAAGYPSPVLPIKVTNENGEVSTSRSRFAFTDYIDGRIETVFYPVLREARLEQFTEEQRKQLSAGKAIVTDIEMPDGKRTKGYVQLDMETNHHISAPLSVIKSNLELFAKVLKMPHNHLKATLEGDLVTFPFEAEEVTLGVDLNKREGVRMSEGNEQAWLNERKREWNKFTFGCYGCWIMDDNGNLDYVREEDYSDALWDEQRKAGQRNAVAMHK